MCRNTPPDFVGQPFLLSLPKSQATFSRLVNMLQTYSRYSVDIFQPPVLESSSASASETSGSSSDTSGSTSPATPLKDAEVTGDEDKDVDTLNLENNDAGDGKDEVDAAVLKNEEAEKPAAAAASTSDPQAQRTQYVMGRPQEVLQKDQIAFRVRTVSGDGTRSFAELEDLGEDPLDLNNVRFISMDWKNLDKCRPYVMVQSKDLVRYIVSHILCIIDP